MQIVSSFGYLITIRSSCDGSGVTGNHQESSTDETPPGSRRSFLSGIAVAGLGTTGLSGRLSQQGERGGQTATTLALAQENDDPIGPTDPIECGQTIAGELTEDDSHAFHEAGGEDFDEFLPVPHDAFEFEADADQFLTFSMTTNETPWYAMLILLDPDGKAVTLPTYTSYRDTPTTFRYNVPETGRYTILATSRLSEKYFEYELSLECQTTRELIGETECISCGDTTTGELTSDDTAGYDLREPSKVHDAYELDLAAGRILRVALVGDPDHEWDREGELNSPTLHVLDEDGNNAFPYFIKDGKLLSNASSFRGNAYLWGRVPADGRYTVLVTSYREASFEYELEVTCCEDEVVQPRRIECGETVSGDIRVDQDRFPLDPPPTDRYQFEGRRGQAMTIRVEFPGDSRSYDLYEPRGSLIRHVSDGTSPFEYTIPSALEGTYTLDLRGSLSQESNPYDLTLECDPAGPPEPDGMQPIECGQTVTAELTADDLTGFRGSEYHHDNYTFDGRRGQNVSLLMESESGNGMLYLLDPDGEVLAQTVDTGMVRDGAIDDVTLEQTGTHRIVATSRTNDVTFEYLLSLFCSGRSD